MLAPHFAACFLLPLFALAGRIDLADAGDGLAEVCAAFAGHDQDGDGTAEIETLRPIREVGETGPRVVLLVEERLLEPLDGAAELRPRLERMADDLVAEGWRAAVVGVRLAQSERHQDGLSLLALRELLRAVAAQDELGGALLVGCFPDAFVVRTCNWRKKGDVTLRTGTPSELVHRGVSFLRRIPEDVAHRADVVLADLDGRWEEVYVQPRTRLETIVAVFPDGVPRRGGPCADLARGGVTFEDFFLVSDGRAEVAERIGSDGVAAGDSLLLSDELGDGECGDADRARPNRLARPDVSISRIDAKGVALRPARSVAGVDGEGLLDDQGRPQAVGFASKEDVPHWREAIWEPDPLLERALLAEYLDRNHAYRTGAAPIARRPSSIACGLGSGFRAVSAAFPGGAEAGEPLADVRGGPGLVTFVEWMRYPALLRTLRAHSDPWGCVFEKAPVEALERELGGPAWSWTPRGERLVPSLDAACRGGKLDFFLLRSLWENGDLPEEPAFYLHTGCHGISPPGAKNRPFDHPKYGLRQGAQALLFYGRGLTLVGRAKVFYDEPRGFSQVLAEGGTFGAAWARYFELESAAASWREVGGDIGRKRSYFWSVLGDWTLRLRVED